MPKTIYELVQNEKERRKLAKKMFLEELGEAITDQDFIAQWSIESIDQILSILAQDPAPYWIKAARRTVKKEVALYKRMYTKFTSGHFEGNDNVARSTSEDRTLRKRAEIIHFDDLI